MSLQIKHISYRINGCLILDDVTATARRGDIIGLIGPNGAGKSTLANVLDAFIVPSSGTARLEERSLIGVSPQQVSRLGVARMFQGQHLPWNSTSCQCLVSVLTSDQEWHTQQTGNGDAAKVAPRDSSAQAEAILARFGLAESSSIPARDLSFGQQRLLALAMACARSSRLLILDEPFAGLKTTALERVLDVLREEAQGKVVVVIDHTLSAIRAVASGIWFMHRGRLTAFRDYPEMAASDVFRSNYLGARGSDNQPLAQTRSGTLATSHHQRAVARSDSALVLKNVSAGYGNKVVIRQVDLEVLLGDVVCVIGLNGSGKSTLLRAILGLARLFEGHVQVFGERVDGNPCDTRVRKGMRVLVQDHRLFRKLTLPDNLLLSAAPVEPRNSRLGWLPLKASEAVLSSVAAKQRMLELTVPNFAARAAGTYSGGEQARVALEQIDFGNPRLILLDEPTSGIDGLAIHSLFAAIQGWQHRTLPIIIVEHNLDFVASVATKVLLLSDGTLTELPFHPGVSAADLFQIFTEAVHFDTNTFLRENKR